MRSTYFLLQLFLLTAGTSAAQAGYVDSLTLFQQEYVTKHEVVKGDDKKQIHFFPVSQEYRVNARVERIENAPWFRMSTSGQQKKVYRVYAVLHFQFRDTSLKLHVYQSQQLMSSPEYLNYLFIPFTDKSNGETSYDNGRYIDLQVEDLSAGSLRLDFNKAYNPYCAYVSGLYNCPVPPAENDLRVSIHAGEMRYH